MIFFPHKYLQKDFYVQVNTYFLQSSPNWLKIENIK